MFDITSGPGDAGHGSFGSPDNSNGYRNGRGRVRGDDFGLTARPSLLGLARTYLETPARFWPEPGRHARGADDHGRRGGGDGRRNGSP
jgi:hypothetical protein